MMLLSLPDWSVGSGHVICHDVNLIELGGGCENGLGIERTTHDILAGRIQQRSSILSISIIYFNVVTVSKWD